MSEVTIVCCYNNEKVFSDFVNTLKPQTAAYELIGIDNSGNKGFSSCAAAYNSVISQVKTKYVIYAHQDILLTGSNQLEQFVNYLNSTGTNDILGVAGVRIEPVVYTNIKQNYKAAGKFDNAGGSTIKGGMMKCLTVDECFFGGHTSYFASNPFDEKLCDGWHLYAVEQCLRTQSDNRAGEVFVCDVGLVHLSDGTLSIRGSKVNVYPPSFYWTFFKLGRKYAKHFPYIRTTCFASQTGFVWLFMRLVKNITRYMLIKSGVYGLIKKVKGRK